MDHTIKVDNEVFKKLQDMAEPLVDTPNTVLRRVLNLSCEENQKHAPSVKRRSKRGYGKLSSIEFRLPIVRALEELGGSGTIEDVLNKVHEQIKSRLSLIDYEKLKSGVIRWENTAAWERFKMVKAGILKNNSPRGIWELADDYKDKLNEI